MYPNADLNHAAMQGALRSQLVALNIYCKVPLSNVLNVVQFLFNRYARLSKVFSLVVDVWEVGMSRPWFSRLEGRFAADQYCEPPGAVLSETLECAFVGVYREGTLIKMRDGGWL